MSLRARLVAALVVLFAVGMGVYGLASYNAFQRSELARLDNQVRGTLPIAERELRLRVDGIDIGRHHARRGFGPADGFPQVVIAPGTYAEMRAPDGTRLDPAILYEDAGAQPDLSGIETPTPDTMWTVPSVEGDTDWRVAGATLGDGRTLLVAVPMTSLTQALDRLLTIELVAGGALLLALGVGAWFVLRSGLQPLERMAAATRSIGAGSLDQRVPTPTTDTEVRQLATAINSMLDDLEGSFREREATEAKLRRFLSDASHELRTPLTSIQGYAELFRLGGDQEHVDLDVVMRRIEDESGRMRELVDNLLALARLDEADTEPVREPVDLTVLAADACSDAIAVDPERPIQLDAPEPAVVPGDASQLRQAIGNLVANALRHTQPGTRIEVAVHADGGATGGEVVAHADGRPAGEAAGDGTPGREAPGREAHGREAHDGEAHGSVEVVVRDHGAGLDDEALQRAFDRFWQADPSRVGVGAGLGLSIVEAVAHAHGGTASARNAADGGAVFTLTLPRAPQRHLDGRPRHDAQGTDAFADAAHDDGTSHAS